MFKSGNDAAIAIAESLGGSIEGFADIMNQMGSSGELMIVGSVTNTFLNAFKAEKLYFTVDGEVFESGHTIYDFELTFFNITE